MDLPMKIVILVVALLIIFVISVMVITNLGQSGGGLIEGFFKWLEGQAKF